jgi:hypothetical protein
MAIRSIRRQATNPARYPGTVNAAPIYVDADDNILKMIPAGSGTTEVEVVDASSTQTLTNKTLTSPVLTTPTGTGTTEVVTTTNVIDAAESGTTYLLSLADGFTSTLPAPAAGLWYKFIVAIAPTTSYVIATNGGSDIMIGGINELAVTTGNDGPYDNNADTLNFVLNVAVVGDWVEFISDGTSWYFTGQTNADGGVTTATS